jgi:DNA ligase 1
MMSLFKFELPMLYARAKTGAVLTWEIEVEGNKYRTITGQETGRKIISAWTICSGKNSGKTNATDDEQQAEAEALAKWKKKLKSGGYWEDVKDIDKVRFVEAMLAHPLLTDRQDHRNNVVYPCMVDRKYNGGRILSTIEGCWTRKGEHYEVIPHLEQAMASLFVKFPGLVLDGEGYNHDLRYKLNELMSIMRTTAIKSITPELISESERLVRYYVYDAYNFTTLEDIRYHQANGDLTLIPKGTEITEDTPCVERRVALKRLIAGISYFVPVPFRWAKTLEEVYSHYEDYVEDGYEGAIIRNAKAPYQHYRTSDLLKVKPVDDDEFVIVDIEDPGSGNWGGTGKIIWFVDKKGNKFKGTFKGSMEVGRKLLKEKADWIGKEVTVEFNGYTGKGIPNYARLNPENCFKNDK